MSAPLKAGRELDLLVARKVMGLTKDDHAVTCASCAGAGESYGVMPYSTSIAAAWEVVEKVIYPKMWQLVPGESGSWTVTDMMDDNWCWVVIVEAETAPLAICLAALEAVRALPTEQETPQ